MAERLCRRVAEAAGLAVVLLLPLWFNPFAAQPFEPAKVGLFRLLSIGIAAASGSWLLLARHSTAATADQASGGVATDLPGNRLALAVVAYAGVSVLATAMSVDPALSLWGTHDNPQGTLILLCGVAFFLSMAILLRATYYARQTVTCLLLGSVPVAVYGLAQYLGLDPLPWMTDSVSPVLSTMGRSNFLGAYLAMVAPFTLSRFTAGGVSGQRLRYVLVLALQVVCLLLTMARGAWLGLVAGCAVFLAFLAFRRKSRGMLVATAITLLVGAVLFAAIDHLPQLGQGRTHVAELSSNSGASLSDLRDISVKSRLLIWKGTLALMPGRWWLGYGPETFKVVFAAHYPGELVQLVGPGLVIDDPHNLILHLLVATGILGAVAYLWVVGALYRTIVLGLHGARDSVTEATLAAALGSVSAFLVQAQFNPNVIVLDTLFWLCLAIATAAERQVLSCSD